MTHIEILIAGACLTIAVPTLAASSPPVDDATYIAAARCQGLITSAKLGPEQAAGINRFMDQQQSGRGQMAMDEASDAKRRAQREAATSDQAERARLIAERDGP